MRNFLFILLLIFVCQIGRAQDNRPHQRKTVAPPLNKEKFLLFLLAGQSNMAGRGPLEAADTIPAARVLRLNEDGVWEEAKDPLHFDKPNAGVGPGLSFGKAMVRVADTSVVIGLIPCAVGGSGIDFWQQGAYYPATKTNPYDDAIKRAKKAMTTGTLSGIIWHQGEADSAPDKSTAYKHKLQALITSFRKDLGMPSLPFVAGQLPDFQIRRPDSTGKMQINEHAIIINKAIAAAGEKIVNYSYVITTDTKHKGDKIHFDAVSARLIGERYAAEMIRILNAIKK